MKVKMLENRCKACGLCIEYCPKRAISISDNINILGYRTNKIDDELCIGCGICYAECPDGVYSVNTREEE